MEWSHDMSCKRWSRAPGDDTTPCTCPPLPSAPWPPSTPRGEQAGGGTSLADVTVDLVPTIENPFPVHDDHGKLLGSAVVTLAAGRFQVRFILDPHHPEVFDLTNEPERCRVGISATLAGGVLSGTVTLTSK
jgi:hypothetical protein